MSELLQFPSESGPESKGYFSVLLCAPSRENLGILPNYGDSKVLRSEATARWKAVGSPFLIENPFALSSLQPDGSLGCPAIYQTMKKFLDKIQTQAMLNN